MKIKVFLFLLFVVLPSSSYSHTYHYENIKFIKMDVLKNGKKIGYNNYYFKFEDNKLDIRNEIVFSTKILGLKIFRVDGKSTEKFENGKLVEFVSETKQNNKNKYVFLKLNKEKNVFEIDGSSFKGEANLSSVIGSWWNHEVLQATTQISPLSGSLKNQEVYFIKKQKIVLNKKEYETNHFKIVSRDHVSKNKHLNFDIWQDTKSKIILKVTYKKYGLWEYRINKYKYSN
ncbi:DUF6134 family protein [Candidatus Pelagibacter communis]|uniref:DUF6134 family protein n=1 Tax=Pelagibacter ubique TaxID=198252 RepID=UPI00094D9D8B|nr:DUF6134 family protein [Candidatus Pelagibacter ubique]